MLLAIPDIDVVAGADAAHLPPEMSVEANKEMKQRKSLSQTSTAGQERSPCGAQFEREAIVISQLHT